MHHLQSLRVHGEELEHLELSHSLLDRRWNRNVDASYKVIEVPVAMVRAVAVAVVRRRVICTRQLADCRGEGRRYTVYMLQVTKNDENTPPLVRKNTTHSDSSKCM